MNSVLPHIILDTGNSPQHSIIWLHGLGADGEDFVPIAQEMNLPVAVRYIFPHAPKQPVTINGGAIMRAWYDIAATDVGRQQDEAGIRSAQSAIEKLIAQEKQRGIAAENIYLAGFSQGGVIALHTGLRHASRLGGVIALSAYLPLTDSNSNLKVIQGGDERTTKTVHSVRLGASDLLAGSCPLRSDSVVGGEANAVAPINWNWNDALPHATSMAAASTPIFMAHGLSDPVILYALGKTSAKKLSELGFQLEWHEYDMAHSVCMEEVRDIEAWLTNHM